MSVTDELREFYRRADGYELWCPRHRKELASIADRIDAEIADILDFCERLQTAAENNEDVTLWGVDYAVLEAKRRKTHTKEYCNRCEGAVLPKWKKCPWCGEPLEEV